MASPAALAPAAPSDNLRRRPGRAAVPVARSVRWHPTDRTAAALKGAKTPAEEFAARRGAIAAIERENKQKTGLRSDVVSLYQGGEYWLYQYKKYTDVRLVFAPEQQIAFFGGDPDNFTYPRFDLDMALFRVYENGKPLETRDHLKWNPAAVAVRTAKRGELVVEEGATTKPMNLTTDDLARGGLIYRGGDQASRFRLTLFLRDRSSFSESAETPPPAH